MNIKHRMRKLEEKRDEELAIVSFMVMCAKTEKRLTETSDRARYIAGRVSKEFERKGGETVEDFKKRARQEGVRFVREVHPKVVFVHVGVKGAEYAQFC
jgi:hypothetical protein